MTRVLLAKAEVWQVGLAFLLGHCCVHSLVELPALPLWVSVLIAAMALAVAARSTLVITLAMSFIAGLAWAGAHGALRLESDLPIRLEGRELLVSGCIASLPDSSATDPQFLFDVTEPRAGVPPRLRLAWYRAPSRPQAGECWRLVVTLKRRSGFANPGGFDFEGHLFREGIGATGYVRDDSRNRRFDIASARYTVTRIRAWLASRMEQAVPDTPMLGVLQGLAVGDAQKVSPEQWRVFAATGTTHLMAISGLHITMIAALAAWLGANIVRWRTAQARGWNAMHGRVIAGAGAALGYSILAGLSIPTQRTLIMLCMYFAMRWQRRELPVAHALGVALIAILVVDPFAPLAAGAWLSFGAVAIILLVTSGRLVQDGVVRGFARVQAAITIGLAPLLLIAFGGISLLSPVANALAVPLFTLLVTPSVLVGALAAALHPTIGAFVLWMPALFLEWTWPSLEWLAKQPLSLWYVAQPSWPALAAMVIGVAVLVLPGIWPTRLAGVLLCLPVLLNRPAVPAVGDFEVALLDVGQGLSVVVRTRSHVLVYDAGPAFRSGRDASELAVLPYLRHRGVRQLDALVISHGDLDHSGGLRSLLTSLPVRRLLAGPSVHPLPDEAAVCRAGQRWSWDGVLFEVLHPSGATHERDNDSSCVVRVAGRGGSALLTGDIEVAAETELDGHGLQRTDIVIVPHHGSRTSSTESLVAALRPRIALVSAGYRNRWGLPKPEVVERWRAAGARTYTTAASGAIEIELTAGEPPRVREYRRSHRRYWHRR
jgi:competence protein ComEC